MAEWLGAAWAAGITLAVLFAGGTTVGFWMLARRTKTGGALDRGERSLSQGERSLSLSKRPQQSPRAAQQSQRAAILLVRADDAVRDARDELDFAIAQFGAPRTEGFARALDAASASVLEAFALQQRLDDSEPDTVTQVRDWTARIIHLCESARASLDAERAEFDRLRTTERSAPADLAALRSLTERLGTRLASTEQRLARLRRDYSPIALSSVADSVERATDAVAAARASADSAGALLGIDTGHHATAAADAAAASSFATTAADPATAAPSTAAEAVAASSSAAAAPGAVAATSATPHDVSSASTAVESIRAGEDAARDAGHLLDAVDELGEQLAVASEQLRTQLESLRAATVEARVVRDNPPDAVTGAAVVDAIARAESALSAIDGHDPLASLERLRDAAAALDSSLAGARNQQQRLDGARQALAGALVSARSQLSATRNFISGRRGSVGSEARTRLAEAERLLVVAEAEADPVAALDTARSAATYARDADALARFDLHR